MKTKPKYTRSVYVPATGKQRADHLAFMIRMYVRERDMTLLRQERAMKKITDKITECENELNKMGNDAFSDEIIEVNA